MSKVTLTLEFELPTATKLARYEVETGRSLADLLTEAVEQWATAQDSQGSQEQVDHRIPVSWAYSPQGTQHTYSSNGRYDINRNEIEIVHSDAPGVAGFRGSPSAASRKVVSVVNPAISPNQNGLNDWQETFSGRTLAYLVQSR